MVQSLEGQNIHVNDTTAVWVFPVRMYTGIFPSFCRPETGTVESRRVKKFTNHSRFRSHGSGNITASSRRRRFISDFAEDDDDAVRQFSFLTLDAVTRCLSSYIRNAARTNSSFAFSSQSSSLQATDDGDCATRGASTGNRWTTTAASSPEDPVDN